MEPERWQAIERIYHAAMQCEEGQRIPYLERACAADQTLRAEVESLLKYGQRPARFFEKPAFEVVAQALAENLRTQNGNKTDKLIGARIGP